VIVTGVLQAGWTASLAGAWRRFVRDARDPERAQAGSTARPS
jgi:hypothetical protein